MPNKLLRLVLIFTVLFYIINCKPNKGTAEKSAGLDSNCHCIRKAIFSGAVLTKAELDTIVTKANFEKLVFEEELTDINGKDFVYHLSGYALDTNGNLIDTLNLKDTVENSLVKKNYLQHANIPVTKTELNSITYKGNYFIEPIDTPKYQKFVSLKFTVLKNSKDTISLYTNYSFIANPCPPAYPCK